MHMADALISPVVGGAMLITTGALEAYCIKKLAKEELEKKIPLMATVGAFVFAAQMINFTIPGTGASGHLCGGILLAALLGPYAGLLSLSTILLIQALFFADGGLLAYGCNVINMGFYSCFIAYPFIYKIIMQKGFSKKRLFTATILASVVGLQLGALSVVVQTLLSGKTTLPLVAFAGMMQPIHLAIGIVEGVIIGTVLSFVHQTHPQLLEPVKTTIPSKKSYGLRVFCVSVILTIAGILSSYASSNPDGLEWSIEKVTGAKELEASGGVYEALEEIQVSTAFLPDYDFKVEEGSEGTRTMLASGTSVAGIVGSILTFGILGIIGAACYLIKGRKPSLKG